MGRVTGPPLLPKADKVPRTKRFTRRTVVASGHAGEMCNTARRLFRGRRGRVVVSVVSFFVKNDYACVRTRTRSLTLTHTHARTAARGESARRDSNVLGAGSLDAQEAGVRRPPALRPGPSPSPRLCPSIVRPSSVHPLSTPAARSPPCTKRSDSGLCLCCSSEGGRGEGSTPSYTPRPHRLPPPSPEVSAKGGIAPRKAPAPPGAVSFPGV